jgi:lipopolysaccharide export system protein LptA
MKLKITNFALVNKFWLLLIIWFFPLLVWGQQGDRLQLISSDSSRLNAVTSRTTTYNPVYDHNGSTLFADSGILYRDELQREFFDAFGHVRITQVDGTLIFADKLNYSADNRIAVLTGNVRMVDGEAVLTTNYLTYNMRLGIGTYTGGGRIINQTDTITSKNAWYFNQSKDAYFRHDVVVRNPDIKIYTDTMRYNSNLKETYFYGPTNMKGNNGENLYTELGFYNTDSKNASFYQKNLYTEGSRFLTGDTLYYEGQTGNGRAVGNVHFIDTADHFHIQGGIGFYVKEEASIRMTQIPLTTYITESKDTTTNQENLSTDSLRLGTDSLERGIDSLGNPIQPTRIKTDSLFLTADTLFSQQIFLKDYVALQFNLDREGGDLLEDEEAEDFSEGEAESDLDSVANTLGLDSLGGMILPPDSLHSDVDSTRIKLNLDDLEIDRTKVIADSVLQSKETLEQIKSEKLTTDSVLLKQNTEIKNRLNSGSKDTLLAQNTHLEDSLLRSQSIIPTGKEVDSLMQGALDATMKNEIKDSLLQESTRSSDTTKTRIIKAYNNVRIYKSDLQAIADSLYFGYPDSMMRMYGQPMIWAENSQLSSEELYLQIKKGQIENMVLINNTFVTSALEDSTRFHQIKGRRITGFFKDDKLERLFVDGNAENLQFFEDKDTKQVNRMYHNRSSRIKVLFKDGELANMIPIKNVEGKFYPIHMAPEEEQQLKGFVWKPLERPRSKADLLERRRIISNPVIEMDSTSTDSTLITDGNLPPKPKVEGVIPPKPKEDGVIPTKIKVDSIGKQMDLKIDSALLKRIDSTKKIIDTIPSLDGWKYVLNPNAGLQNKLMSNDVVRPAVELRRPNYIYLVPSRKWRHNLLEKPVPTRVC